MSETPLVDRAILDELIDSIGAEGACSVIELFIEESRGYLATIAAAAAAPENAADRERARRAAHTLKSGAGQVGAAAMARAAAAVEGAVAGGAADLSETVAALARCGAATTATLGDFLSR